MNVKYKNQVTKYVDNNIIGILHLISSSNNQYIVVNLFNVH